MHRAFAVASHRGSVALFQREARLDVTAPAQEDVHTIEGGKERGQVLALLRAADEPLGEALRVRPQGGSDVHGGAQQAQQRVAVAHDLRVAERRGLVLRRGRVQRAVIEEVVEEARRVQVQQLS